MSKPPISRAFGAVLLALALSACAVQGGPTATSTPAPTSASEPTASAPAPTTQPAATSAPAPTAQPAADIDAAVQVVADYYAALDQQQFEAAYQMWANHGQASGLSFEQFQQGFGNTAGTQLELGAAHAVGSTVSVPVELIAIDNDGQSQRVSQYRGSYTLTRASAAWQITAAQIGPASGALPPADRSDPAQTLQQYYAAISGHALPRAYTLWGGNGRNSGQRYAEFARGFANTAQVRVFLGQASDGAAAGSRYSSIPTLVVAGQAGGSELTFCGNYTLRRLNVPPFDQLGWRIERAEMAPHAAVAAGEAAAQQVLASGCT